MYSVDKITSLEDCNAILKTANQNKVRLAGRRSAEQTKSDVLATTEDVDLDLQVKAAELAASNGILDSLPESQAKKELKQKIRDLEDELSALQKRKIKFGIQALLKNEYSIITVDQQIAENDAYIAALEERKGKL